MTLSPPLPEDLALKPVTVNFHPGPEYAQRTRTYQGVSGIERATNGRLWATWYSGGRTEDKDNHVVLVTSDDNGQTWSEPVLVIDPPADIRASDSMLWHDPLGRLWLFWMQNKTHPSGGTPYDGRGGVWCIRCTDSSLAAPAWSAPRRIANGTMINKPTVLSTGEWLMPCSVFSRGGPYPFSAVQEQFSNVFVSRDNGETFTLLGSADVPNRHWDEHMVVERCDGSLWMLVRRLDGIGEAVSLDRGKTWTASPDAVLQGPCARFHIRRLRSGRLLLINHYQFTKRSHLTALLSEDDGITWPHHLLLDERSNVSYPDAVETPEGHILVIYDHERIGEGEILLQEFTEEDILYKRSPGYESGRIRVVSHLERQNIGSRGKLFADPSLIDQMDNVTCQLHRPVQKKVACVVGQPCEESATFRIDGSMSVNAPCVGGQLSLKPLRFQGATLRLNFATAAAGSIRVQIEDFNGLPIQGYALEDCGEISGDALDRQVQWKHGADISALVGKLVRIRFALSDADLYSFRFE